jgi:hypothetical protein
VSWSGWGGQEMRRGEWRPALRACRWSAERGQAEERAGGEAVRARAGRAGSELGASGQGGVVLGDAGRERGRAGAGTMAQR